jgi:hypothetical protein
VAVSSYRNAVNRQHNHGANKRHEKAGRITRAVQAKRLSEETADQRADDTENGRNDDPAAVTARHQQLCDRTNYQAEHYPSK